MNYIQLKNDFLSHTTKEKSRNKVEQVSNYDRARKHVNLCSISNKNAQTIMWLVFLKEDGHNTSRKTKWLRSIRGKHSTNKEDLVWGLFFLFLFFIFWFGFMVYQQLLVIKCQILFLYLYIKYI